VDHINDLLFLIVDTLFLASFGRWVATNVKTLTTDADLLAVGFVCYSINLLEVVRVGDDLVVGDEVLFEWERKRRVSPLCLLA
jgi:hypothetical protein